MWSISTADAPSSAFHKYQRNHPNEYASVFANLQRVKGFLDAGHNLGAFQLSWFRAEGAGVYRIGQTGVPRAYETRLYVCFDAAQQVVHILGIGDKSSQPRDVPTARRLAARILPQEE